MRAARQLERRRDGNHGDLCTQEVLLVREERQCVLVRVLKGNLNLEAVVDFPDPFFGRTEGVHILNLSVFETNLNFESVIAFFGKKSTHVQLRPREPFHFGKHM